ncbi:MAG: AAA family ATPase [Ignavibacterium sp.]|nr:AAA family ATPase [Ignavibacterium sp.]
MTTKQTKQKKGLVNKFKNIEAELNEVIFERNDEIHSLMLGLLTNTHVLFLGSPGTAKSMLATYFTKHIEGAKMFKYLLSKTTAPEEILGPISLKELTENERVVHKTTGFLPESEIAFLDEVFKANSPLQNTLLSIINERKFFNGNIEQHVPLRMLVTASNEIPLDEEDSQAFIDRLLQQFWVRPISEHQNLLKMFKQSISHSEYTPKTKITLDEIEQAQKEVQSVLVPDDVLNNFLKLLSKLEIGIDNGNGKQISIVLSERRKALIIKLLQAEAYLRERDVVKSDDFEVLYPAFIRAKNEKDFINQKKSFLYALSEIFNPYKAIVMKIVEEAKEIQNKVLQIDNELEKSNAVVDARHSLTALAKNLKDIQKQAERENNATLEVITNIQEAILQIQEINKSLLESVFLTDFMDFIDEK